MWHIFFNMLFLWWFGSEIEQVYGSREFLAFYLVVAAFLGGGGFPNSRGRWSRAQICSAEASGAVTAVLVLYAFHYPVFKDPHLLGACPCRSGCSWLFWWPRMPFTLSAARRPRRPSSSTWAVPAFAALYYKLATGASPGVCGRDCNPGGAERTRPNLRVYHP